MKVCKFEKIKDDNQLFKEKLDEAINDNNELQTNYQKEKEYKIPLSE